MQHRMPEGIVKALNNTVLSFISRGRRTCQRGVRKNAGADNLSPWLVLIPIFGFFFLKDADSFRRSVLAMLPRGRLRWRGDELFQDINSTLAAYIRAQLTACLMIGVVCSVGFRAARSAESSGAWIDCRHARVRAVGWSAGSGHPACSASALLQSVSASRF